MANKPTYLVLPDRTKRMAQMAAARAGQKLSEYVDSLIIKDCNENGIAALVTETVEEDGIVEQDGIAALVTETVKEEDGIAAVVTETVKEEDSLDALLENA